MITFNEMFDMYLKHVKKHRRYDTYLYYQKDFKWCRKALKHLKVINADDVSDSIFEDMYDYFLEYSNKKNSQLNKIVSSFITVLNFYGIEYPKRYKLMDDTEHTKVIKDDEYNQLKEYLSSLNLKEGNNLSLVLAIYLALDSGVRMSELIDIRFKNVDFITKSIELVHTKNGKRRIAFFGSLSEDLIKKASKYRKEFILWNYNTDVKLTKTCIHKFLDKLNAAGSYAYPIHMHRFRKTYATRLLRKGCSLPVISKLLGHSSVEQTMVYLEIDFDMLKVDYDKYYPN